MILSPGVVMAVAEDVSFLDSNGLYVMIVMSVVAVIYIVIDYHKKKRR